MKCPLCGLVFKEEDGQAACTGCSMSGSCSLIKCPNCSYEVPREPKLLRSLRRWLKAWRGAGQRETRGGSDGLPNLATVRSGTKGRVAYLRSGNDHRLQKLMSMGILPGSSIEVLQTYPAFVLGVGHTQVAIDEEMARDIFIKRGTTGRLR